MNTAKSYITKTFILVLDIIPMFRIEEDFPKNKAFS